MNRRKFLAASGIGLAAVAGGVWWVWPRTSFRDLRRGVGIFQGLGGTIGWLVTGDGLVVVDSDLPWTAQACLDGLNERSARPIELLVNTHHHWDHTGGNQTFRPAVKSIVAHANCDKLHRSTTQESSESQAYADTTFTDDWNASLGDEIVSARYYGPAHTGGDVVVTFERANVVHMGDLMFHKHHPFIDRPAGASIANWITSLDRVASDHPADTIYIFGHGRPDAGVTGSRASLTSMSGYLTALLEHTRKQIAAGKSKDEVVSSISAVPGFEEYAIPMMVRMMGLSLGAAVATAYDELNG